MKISIQQPENLPWLGFFDKVRQVDMVVFFDNVQFKHTYWENRNKIRTAQGWQWITVPTLSTGYYQNICDVKIDNSQRWQRSIWNALRYNYPKAPFWEEHKNFFENLYKREWVNLVDFNIEVIKYIAKQLGLDREFVRASHLYAEGKATEALVSICKATGANEYLSGAFGRDYIDESLFNEAGIGLEYQDFNHPTYSQVYQPFLSYMSTIDLLFNEGSRSLEIIGRGN